MSNKTIPKVHRNVKTPVLEDQLDLIRKVAWRFAKQYHLDVDDLFQEAYISCLKALPRYNPNRGAFSTFLWHTSTNAIRDILNKNQTYTTRHLLTDDFSLQEDTEVTPGPLHSLMVQERFMELWALLSPEAQEVCRLVLLERDLYRQTRNGNFRRTIYKRTKAGHFRRPVNLPTNKPRRCKAAIEAVLTQRGWSRSVIRQAFNEIQRTFSVTT